jgi:hypothetical protein
LDPEYVYEWFIETITPDVEVGSHDVAGSLIETWEFVESRPMGLLLLKLIGRANEIAPPYTPGIAPQTGLIPLIKVLADVHDIPDDEPERTVNIYIQHNNLDNFSFSDEDGFALGVITDTIIDTSWFECLQWDGEDCLFWNEVGEGPADSFWCCDTILNGRLDTSKVKITKGSLTVLSGMCGDVNCDNSINIKDITYLIKYKYKGGEEPCGGFYRGDVNSDGSINIKDITYLIKYKYKDGPEPTCSL